jgi:hypothetical protein
MASKEINIDGKKKVLIIHHWDCDGLCSAALISGYLKEINSEIKIEFFLPKIGYYFFQEDDFLKIKKIGPDLIFIIDMAFQVRDVIKLKTFVEKLYIFDHHKQEIIKEVNHSNPFSSNNIDSLSFPSTGWVVNDFFKKEQNLLSVLGAIGDQESKVSENPVVKKILNESGFSFDDCTKIVQSIDSCYITDNAEEIYRVIDILKNKELDIRSILDNSQFLKNKKIINKKIEEIMDENFLKDDIKKIIFKRIKCNFQIISGITRKISAGFPDYLVITINESDNDLANIYFRTGNLNADLTPIISYAKSKKYNAGGKKEVVGIFCPLLKVEEALKDILSILKR